MSDIYDQREATYTGIRVIKRGTPPSEKIYQVSCSECKSELEFKRSAARISPDPRDNGILMIDCPVCGRALSRMA